ncbi:ClpXP protease specificity-enhancing factor [Providencia rettgeri]|uniref:Stringent starvation protein B n=3 Tax=Gammaproteobacteria TaxID=1236 RepID=A0AAP2JWP7_PRORE|nr:Stringent starvation protein B [Providencia rettgeri]NIL70659.1 ClpXP protease specificity-enhancing factor [Providencia sp. 504mA]HCI97272.1 ClpXP protease specificity-enhancing factor [Providencia sp.]AVL72752.1 ClpXP protease specificity-enhancing factor [Providencia rettgeri]MBX6949286.1 ClpXP protease specificity-enhancing factor [Providencia rettgeri]
MMEMTPMSPRRPYLLRAHYEWLLDNDMTPHLVVDVTVPDVNVPMEFARDGQIVLNVAPRAVGNFEITNEEVRFNARFGGVPRQVYVPMSAIMAVYARENGAGMMFEPETAYDAELSSGVEDIEEPEDNITLVHEADLPDESSQEPSGDEPPRPPKGRPALRVVK